MRFFVTYWPNGQQAPTAADQGNGKMEDYSRRSQAAGTLVSQGMFAPTATEISLSDGHFSTADRENEALGFAYIEAPSADEAMEHVREFLQVAGGGRTLIRPLADSGGRS